MRFNSVKGSDYSSGARAVNKNSDAAFDASRKSSFDFTGVSIAAQQGRSQMRQAADSAQGTKDVANIRKQASKDVAKVIKKSSDKVADIKRPAQRMAGIVGGLGVLSQGAMLYKGIKDDKAADAKREARYDQQSKDMQALIKAQQNRAPFVPGTAPVTPDPTIIPIPSSTTTPQTGNTSHKPNNTGLRHMQAAIANGYSPVSAATIAGQTHYESDGFRALEEYAPNAYGTKGYGHLQWTNIPGGSQRRTAFEDYARNSGLKPSSFEANSGFLLHEMRNVPGSWTGGRSAKGFNDITDLDQASDYLRDGFIRPQPGSEQARRNLGHAYLDYYNNSIKN